MKFLFKNVFVNFVLFFFVEYKNYCYLHWSRVDIVCYRASLRFITIILITVIEIDVQETIYYTACIKSVFTNNSSLECKILRNRSVAINCRWTAKVQWRSYRGPYLRELYYLDRHTKLIADPGYRP